VPLLIYRQVLRERERERERERARERERGHKLVVFYYTDGLIGSVCQVSIIGVRESSMKLTDLTLKRIIVIQHIS